MSKIRVYPHVTALGEWLQWTFVQLQDWDKAFVYTRSLDLRLRENGYRMFRLGYLCKSNGELQQALKCFDYCLKKGEDGYEYGTALGQWFDIKYQLLSNQNDSTEWAGTDRAVDPTFYAKRFGFNFAEDLATGTDRDVSGSDVSFDFPVDLQSALGFD